MNKYIIFITVMFSSLSQAMTEIRLPTGSKAGVEVLRSLLFTDSRVDLSQAMTEIRLPTRSKAGVEVLRSLLFTDSRVDENKDMSPLSIAYRESQVEIFGLLYSDILIYKENEEFKYFFVPRVDDL